jgi:hypothetical protein
LAGLHFTLAEDRFLTSLVCYSCLSKHHHHLRSLTEDDPDFSPLQHRQAKDDQLTDSESDEDEKYHASKPSMKKVRDILKGGGVINPPRPITGCCMNALIFCVHYLCLIGQVYGFYVGHVDRAVYMKLFPL